MPQEITYIPQEITYIPQEITYMPQEITSAINLSYLICSEVYIYKNQSDISYDDIISSQRYITYFRELSF